MERVNSPWSWVTTALMLSLTLGLSPFFPEPHVWGKLKWVWGGAKGMGWVDWFDLLMHGTPWVLLLGTLVYALFHRRKMTTKRSR